MRVKIVLSLIVVLAIGFFVGMYAGSRGAAPGTASGPAATSTAQASVMIDYGGGKVSVYNGPVSSSENLLAFMQDVTTANKVAFASKSYSGMGTLVTQIGNDTNGAGGAYWQYWVNNRYAQTGADSYIVQPGDIIEWKFTTYQG